MHNIKHSIPGTRQRGMGMTGVIFTVGLVAFFMTILLKIGPLYLNFWTIRSIMTDVSTQTEPLQGGQRAIIDSIGKRMDVNSVRNITTNEFEVIKQDQNVYRVTVNYEQRVHLFFNIDAVAMFTYQVDVTTQ